MPIAQITLTTANTAYRLVDLLRATVGSSNNPYPNQSPYCRELIIVNDPNNGAAIIAIIPTGLASPLVTKGLEITAGGSLTQRSIQNNIDLASRALVTNTNSTLIEINWESA
jgi:hypothetical protein